MPRFILRYKGAGGKPDSDLKRIREQSAITVVDETPRMLLVEGDAKTIDHLRGDLADWLVTPETQFSVPDPRQHIKRPID